MGSFLFSRKHCGPFPGKATTKLKRKFPSKAEAKIKCAERENNRHQSKLFLVKYSQRENVFLLEERKRAGPRPGSILAFEMRIRIRLLVNVTNFVFFKDRFYIFIT